MYRLNVVLAVVIKNKQAVFSVTSDGCDYFSAMTRIAVASLRISNPSLEICICCDDKTNRSCKSMRDPLLDEADAWQPQETPAGTANFRNRFVKTRLRTTVDGAFLFLDSDVLVRGDLASLFDLDTDLAIARNHSLDDYGEQIWKTDAATLEALGWQVRSDVYVNGGGLLYQDTEGAHQFAEEWHRRWLHCVEARHNHRDQPALNAALQATQARLYQLPDRFNAQFKRNLRVLQGAALWHYYSSGIGSRPDTLFDVMVRDLMQGKPLNKTQVERMIEAPHPWRLQSGLGDWVFARGIARGWFLGWELALLRQDIPRYLYRNFRNFGGRAWRALRQAKSLTSNA